MNYIITGNGSTTCVIFTFVACYTVTLQEFVYFHHLIEIILLVYLLAGSTRYCLSIYVYVTTELDCAYAFIVR